MNLTLTNLTKQYGSFTALQNFNYEFIAGVYGLLGPNGAGKSTLMNIITDNLKATSGLVRFDGEDITKWMPTSEKYWALCPSSRVYTQTLP